MKIFFARYLLHPVRALNALADGEAREGALLKLELPSGVEGFADLHPWPELGDDVVTQQLEDLKNQKFSALTTQSVWLAKRDAKAREHRKSLWLSDVRIPNNFLIAEPLTLTPTMLDGIKAAGFTCLKLKCGRDLKQEAALVNRLAAHGAFSLRLDFNSTGTAETWAEFGKLVLPESDAAIEYVEDPSAYDHVLWSRLRKRWKVALDHEISRAPWSLQEAPAADVLVLKPARQKVEENIQIALHWKMSVTVTSSMDHPVGVLHAYTLAQELKKQHGERILPTGCLTIGLYHPDLFSAAAKTEGPYLLQPAGFGVGFDQALAELTWQSIDSL